MIPSKNRGGSPLFFLELIIVLGLFVLTSTILLGALSKAHTMRQTASEQTKAMIIMQALAENIKIEGLDAISFPLYYNEDMEEVENVNEADFKVEAQIRDEERIGGILEYVDLEMSQIAQEKQIWVMDFTTYRRK